jgi:predicted helicase
VTLRDTLGFTGYLSKEANATAEVKRSAPITVVIGNPPYSGHSANKGEWIGQLVRDYHKSDFPRVPLTCNLALFRALAARGAELVALHLLESPVLDMPITRCTVRSDDFSRPQAAEAATANLVAPGYSRYDHGAVWINPSTGFAGVPEAVWQFQVGGYQVCHKWLKDRRDRVLTTEDITHYGKIVVALNETLRLMGEIDKVIEEHGGRPMC